MSDQNSFLKYWEWFFKGSGGKAGFRRLINLWFIIHIIIGIILSFIVNEKLNEISNTVLIPLIGILIGLSFAWAGNAQVLLQSTEIEELSKYHKGGFIEFVYIFQTAILAILITLVIWALAGLSVFDKFWPTQKNKYFYFVIKIILFTFCSLTLRECWHVVLGSQWMLLIQRKIRLTKKNKKN